VLHDVIAHGHLAIGDEHDLIVLAHAKHGSAMRQCTSPSIRHSTSIPQTVQ
jgi:hypothetical protein